LLQCTFNVHCSELFQIGGARFWNWTRAKLKTTLLTNHQAQNRNTAMHADADRGVEVEQW